MHPSIPLSNGFDGLVLSFSLPVERSADPAVIPTYMYTYTCPIVQPRCKGRDGGRIYGGFALSWVGVGG
jgi:hypothetical protein